MDKLRIIQDVYFEPIQSMNLLTRTEFNTAFPKVIDLLKLHSEMYEQIDAAIKKNTGLGEALLPFVFKYQDCFITLHLLRSIVWISTPIMLNHIRMQLKSSKSIS